MKINKLLVSSLFICFSLIFAWPGHQTSAEELFAPDPELLYPVTDKVDLKGQTQLVFKWSPFVGDLYKRNYFEFCLYKGYETYEKNLIIKEKVAPNVYVYAVSSDQFEDGQVYTWTLRQVYTTMAYKSNAEYNSFTVVKK